MRDDAYTNPAIIRSTYQARGRNKKLNIAKVELLGIAGSSVSPTQGGTSNSGGTGAGLGGSGDGIVLDPTLYSDPGATYEGGTYQDNTYSEGDAFISDLRGDVI